MDKIIFQNLRFFAHHGYFLHERQRGQHFEIDLELHCNLYQSGRTDRLGIDGIDYGAIYQRIKAIVCGEQFQLLEALAQNICSALLESFQPIEAVLVRVRKPEAPLEGGIIPDKELLNSPEPALDTAWNTGQFGKNGAVAIELLRHRA